MDSSIPLSFVRLPSGAKLARKNLSGEQFFEAQTRAQVSRKDAIMWVLLKAFEVNGNPLNSDTLEKMDSQDFATLIGLIGTLLTGNK